MITQNGTFGALQFETQWQEKNENRGSLEKD